MSTLEPVPIYIGNDLDRLTNVAYHDSDTEAFNMDDLGNRDGNQTLRDDGTVNFTVDDDTNRYTAIGGNSITHDDAGNMTVDKDAYQYSYDYENRVVKIEDVNDVTVATYAYDALGRRIRKVDSVADETTLYYYNPDWQVLAEYNSSGTLQRYFIYGNYIDEPLVMNDGTDDYYYAHDHLYSVVALLEADGDVTERYEYDAYGKAIIYTDHGGDDDWFDGDETTADYSAIGNPYYFTGRRLDILDEGNKDIYYYRERYYGSYMARFYQHDPLGIDPADTIFIYATAAIQYSDGGNLYESFSSNAILEADPYGLQAVGPPAPPAYYFVDGPVPAWPPYPDVGEAPWWLPEPTIILRRIRRAGYALAGTWAIQGYNDGASYLSHFLGNTGSPIIADYTRMLTDSGDARGYFLEQVHYAQAAAELHAVKGEVKQITSAGNLDHGQGINDSPNWYRAIGSHYTWGRGHIKKSGCCYMMDLTVHIRDKYDFDLDVAGLPVQPLWWLEYYGWAKGFKVRGRQSITIKWPEDYRFGDALELIQGRQRLFLECIGKN